MNPKATLGRWLFYGSLLSSANRGLSYQIVEHQKSGGSWLAQLLAGYFGIPFHSQPDGWKSSRGVFRIHSPRQYTTINQKQIYIIRDGRDVLTSYYFHVLFREKHPLKRLFIDLEDVAGNMSKFLALYFQGRLGNKILWHDHAQYWRPKVGHWISYEALHASTNACLSGLLRDLGEDRVDTPRLAATIKKYSFEAMVGRRPGEEDRHSFHRKGIVGDWRNSFTRAAAELFEEKCGNALRVFGYETDSRWVGEVPKVATCL
ncbi:sulfotransferase domain-containing protein [Gemmatimonadota bacterium]